MNVIGNEISLLIYCYDSKYWNIDSVMKFLCRIKMKNYLNQIEFFCFCRRNSQSLWRVLIKWKIWFCELYFFFQNIQIYCSNYWMLINFLCWLKLLISFESIILSIKCSCSIFNYVLIQFCLSKILNSEFTARIFDFFFVFNLDSFHITSSHFILLLASSKFMGSFDLQL